VQTTVVFRCLTTPFCYGEYGAVNCRCTPYATQYSMNSLDMNSPPRSVLSANSLQPDSAAARAWNSLMDAAARSLDGNSASHM